MSKIRTGPGKRFSEKIKYSIVLRLNVRLFFRLFGIFLTLDILICALFCGGLFFNTENTAATYIASMEVDGLPEEQALFWAESSGYKIELLDRPVRGTVLPRFIQIYLPTQTNGGARTITLGAGNTSWMEHLRAITYTIELPGNGIPFAVIASLHRPVSLFFNLLQVLLVVQLIMLLLGLGRNARSIRQAMRPVYELADTARELNSRSFMTPGQLQKLAGTLDAINASRLDTRLPVSGTQDELKTIASAINAMLDRINEAYLSQIRFVSDASHELRTPISVIQGYANLLDRWGKNDPATMQESITAIKNESESMQKLVEQLLFLARSDNNTLRLNLTTFDVSEIIEDVFRETKMIDPAHTFELRLNSPVPVHADIGLIKQAVRILVDNGIKYTPAGGTIILAAKTEKDQASIFVQDEGTGIPPAALPYIFDRFYRTDESRARKTGGTGLGLSIAKRIVDEHGGHFEVLSRQQIGTRITILLSLADPMNQPPA